MKRLILIPLIFLLLSCEDKQESIENNVPVANDISIMTNEDVAVSIGYSDNNDATLVYEVVDAPTTEVFRMVSTRRTAISMVRIV